MIDTNAYEKMTWETPSDELEDAVGNLLAEVKQLRLDLASGRITTIVNPNDDHNRTLYVTIEFPDGEVYRGYVEKEGDEE
tara:strand:- start:267 stop:506 length:240 start_codon:yes stop_codon:yes gene_type:complete